MLGKGSLVMVTSFSINTITPVLRGHLEVNCNTCPEREASVFGEQRKLCLIAHC